MTRSSLISSPTANSSNRPVTFLLPRDQSVDLLPARQGWRSDQGN